ncbi:MAG: hypothetical protein ACRDA5_08920 [Clostridium sp.]
MKLVQIGLILATGVIMVIIECAPYIKIQKLIEKAKSEKDC